uniref:DUF4200 domain-containing protein n=2 Tax=Macrostomum lignano TaxID=282301 RepID=A0A1I8I398_9PLAT
MDVSMEEYFRTTFEDKLLVKMPEREDDHLTSATRLLEKKREMMEVETALSAQKEEFQMKMESLQQRREELEKKEHQLKESLLKFDRFLKETDAKRVRAVKKAGDERAYRRQKEQEIVEIQGEMRVYSQLRERLKALSDRYERYQKFLEKVIEESNEFTEVREVMDRYETLSSTKKDLKRREDRNQETVEGHKSEQSRYKESKANEVLSQNNVLSGLRERLDESASRALQCEAEWTQVKNSVADRTLQLGMIRVATHNLCQLVSRYRDQGDDIDLDDEVLQVTSEQLARVQQFVLDLTAITDRVARGAIEVDEESDY